jgi:hypothetical protein
LISLEKLGLPTVAIVADGFVNDAAATAHSLGVADFRYVVTPDCLTSISPEETTQRADDVLDGIVEALTVRVADAPPPPPNGSQPEPAESEPFDGADSLAAFDQMNLEFLDRGWGDGFPLIPPTPERVAEMLRACSRDPQEVITVLEPGMGYATVEKIAINAVLAGCEPVHLPILVAAVKAIADPAFHLRMVAMSTGPHAPLLVINGPIAKALGINSGRCALGPGRESRANTVIGRALRLILMNVGLAYPGVMDMDTIGSPAKYGMCIAENEDQNPWAPLHVERGFRPEQSTVTAFSSKHQLEIDDVLSYTPEGVLTGVAASISMPGGEYMDERRVYHHVLLLCPDHARLIAKAGWSKQGIRDYLYQNAVLPWRLLRHWYVDEGVRPELRWILSLPPETPVPIVGGPDWYQIVVVGGPAGKNAYMSAEGLSVTIPIEDGPFAAG